MGAKSYQYAQDENVAPGDQRCRNSSKLLQEQTCERQSYGSYSAGEEAAGTDDTPFQFIRDERETITEVGYTLGRSIGAGCDASAPTMRDMYQGSGQWLGRQAGD